MTQTLTLAGVFALAVAGCAASNSETPPPLEPDYSAPERRVAVTRDIEDLDGDVNETNPPPIDEVPTTWFVPGAVDVDEVELEEEEFDPEAEPVDD